MPTDIELGLNLLEPTTDVVYLQRFRPYPDEQPDCRVTLAAHLHAAVPSRFVEAYLAKPHQLEELLAGVRQPGRTDLLTLPDVHIQHALLSGRHVLTYVLDRLKKHHAFVRTLPEIDDYHAATRQLAEALITYLRHLTTPKTHARRCAEHHAAFQAALASNHARQHALVEADRDAASPALARIIPLYPARHDSTQP